MLLQLQPCKETICPPAVGVAHAVFARSCRDLFSKQLLRAQLRLQPRTSGPAVTNVAGRRARGRQTCSFFICSVQDKKEKEKKKDHQTRTVYPAAAPIRSELQNWQRGY